MNDVNPLILVVEDNPDDEALTVRAWKTFAPHARLVVARDGEEALRCLTGKLVVDGMIVDEVPDFFLLDLKLPKLTGESVLKEIRACVATACMPVVMFTSSDDPGDVVRCYNAGANTYVTKPLDFAKYMDAIGSIASYWFDVARLPKACMAAAP